MILSYEAGALGSIPGVRITWVSIFFPSFRAFIDPWSAGHLTTHFFLTSCLGNRGLLGILIGLTDFAHKNQRCNEVRPQILVCNQQKIRERNSDVMHGAPLLVINQLLECMKRELRVRLPASELFLWFLLIFLFSFFLLLIHPSLANFSGRLPGGELRPGI
jgi:hypothetical protein